MRFRKEGTNGTHDKRQANKINVTQQLEEGGGDEMRRGEH